MNYLCVQCQSEMPAYHYHIDSPAIPHCPNPQCPNYALLQEPNLTKFEENRDAE